jgi:AraC family transcriptional activator of pyochelin receptor
MQQDESATELIQVSDEMIAMIGTAPLSQQGWPDQPVAFAIDLRDSRQPPSLRFFGEPTREPPVGEGGFPCLYFIVTREACERLRGGPLSILGDYTYLLGPSMRPILQSIRDCALPKASATPYRLAKCIELLCEILEADRVGTLIPIVGRCTLSETDRRRILASRTMIEERSSEPLTLDQIARQCGINRSKLSRGFREIYGTSVADAIAECRLAQARQALLGTDLPVGLIGYRSGYQNNASFTRAFGRRYGVSPSSLRSRVN